MSQSLLLFFILSDPLLSFIFFSLYLSLTCHLPYFSLSLCFSLSYTHTRSILYFLMPISHSLSHCIYCYIYQIKLSIYWLLQILSLCSDNICEETRQDSIILPRKSVTTLMEKYNTLKNSIVAHFEPTSGCHICFYYLA